MIPLGFAAVLLACGALWTTADALKFSRSQARQILRSTKETPIHIFTFQKDESKFLLDWFNYHSNLIGTTRNIHVIDHNSTTPATLRILAQIKRRGGEVIKYGGKFIPGAKYTEVMRRHINESSFLIPLDADEFLVGIKNRNIVIDPSQVRQIFSRLPMDGFRYKFQSIVGIPCDLKTREDSSIPIAHRATSFLIDNDMSHCVRKTFYYSKSFVLNGEGNHAGAVTADVNCDYDGPLFNAECNFCQHENLPLGTLHFGAAHSFAEHDQKMTRGAIARGFNVSMRSSKRCPRRNGLHYCHFVARKNKLGIKYMRKEYEKQRKEWCSRDTLIKFSELSEVLSRMRKSTYY